MKPLVFKIPVRLLGALVIASSSVALAQCPPADNPDDPCMAAFNGGQIRLSWLEEFARELPDTFRCPSIAESAKWREFICSELAKDVAYTTRAKQMGYDSKPEYLRGRGYFIQEYLSYAMLRDFVINKIDISPERVAAYYATHRNDFIVSPSVTLRLIRTRDTAKAQSAARRLSAGESFDAVEADISEAGPRQKGQVLGPYPQSKKTSDIPPPKQVIDAALATPAGQTTGPVTVGQFFFVAKTITSTPRREYTLPQVAQHIRTIFRNEGGDRLTRDLLKTLTDEVGVQLADDRADRPDTNPDDVIATVGESRITYREYTDLNKHVRGPAQNPARFQKTKLAQFITPHLFTEAGKRRGYTERPEFMKALEYYDLLHLSSQLVDEELLARVPQPSEETLRGSYDENRKDFVGKGGKIVPFELARDSIREAIMTKARSDLEPVHLKEVAKAVTLQLCPNPTSSRITAFEALFNARSLIPANARLVSISSNTEAETTSAASTSVLPLIGGARRAAWNISYTDPASSTPRILVSKGPAEISDPAAQIKAIPAYQPWTGKWLFDTDALLRVAIDAGLADFYAKYDGRAAMSVTVDFNYSGETPTDAVVTYAAHPADMPDADSMSVTYSAFSGHEIKEN